MWCLNSTQVYFLPRNRPPWVSRIGVLSSVGGYPASCGSDGPWDLKVLHMQLAHRRSRNGEGTPTSHFLLPSLNSPCRIYAPRVLLSPAPCYSVFWDTPCAATLEGFPALWLPVGVGQWGTPTGDLRVTSGCLLPSFPSCGFDSDCCIFLNVIVPFLWASPGNSYSGFYKLYHSLTSQGGNKIHFDVNILQYHL